MKVLSMDIQPIQPASPICHSPPQSPDTPQAPPTSGSMGRNFVAAGTQPYLLVNAPCTKERDVLQQEVIKAQHTVTMLRLERDLVLRAKCGDPEVSQVGRGECFSVDISPGERKHIFTQSLADGTIIGDSLVMVAMSRHPGGRQSLTLSHCSANGSISDQLQDINNALNAHHSPDNANVEHQLLLITAGDYVPDTNGKHALEPRHSDQFKQLSSLINTVLPQLTPKVLPYSPAPDEGISTAFMLKIDKWISYDGIVSGRCKYKKEQVNDGRRLFDSLPQS